ncbi:MAG TPA: hypothetical protein VGH25_07030, partial [Dongiaceae bacterium]
HRARRPTRLELFPQRMFMLETLEQSRRWIFAGAARMIGVKPLPRPLVSVSGPSRRIENA